MSTPLIPAREDNTHVELSDGPGRRLRSARQTQGLTHEHAAGELHLSPAMIEALERDDYAALPRDDVFVVGYIRKYAQLVDLAPGPLVTAYRAAVSRTAPAQAGASPRTGFRIDSGHLVMGAIGLGVLILLGALAFLWYQSRQPDPEVEATAAGAVRATTPTATLEAVPEPRTSAPATDPDPIAVREEKPPPQPESDTRVRTPQPVDPATPAASEPRPTATTTTEGVEEKSFAGAAVAATDTQPPAIAPNPEETERTEKTEEPIAAEADEIEIIFDGPCWAEVRDEKREYNLRGMMKKGDRYVLGGKPPYFVKLGNSTIVRITIGGEPLDLSTLSRGSVVARFTLDPDQLP